MHTVPSPGPGRRIGRHRLKVVLNLGFAVVYVVVGLAVILAVSHQMRSQAREEAEQKAQIILNQNLAVHEYFNVVLKPAVLALTRDTTGADFFDPTWMSSTFVLRRMREYLPKTWEGGIYYKDAAVNARSPANEADVQESAFIAALDQDPGLETRTEVQAIDGSPYLVVMRRGEQMATDCLPCHGDPADAPAALLASYGSTRSFGRTLGSWISTASLRIPLIAAYAGADRVTWILVVVLLGCLALLFGVQFAVYDRLVYGPLGRLRSRALQVTADPADPRIRVPLVEPGNEEIGDVTRAFNRMTDSLLTSQERMEREVAERTSEAVRLNDQLRQAQKLEAVGALAGGIAHDFNNLLTVITAHTDHLIEATEEDDPRVKDLHEMRSAADRGAALVRQLLALARREPSKPTITDLTALLVRVEQIVARLLGESRTLIMDLAPDLPPVLVDSSQMQQVLLNLVLNARDALPPGGSVRIRTRKRMLEASEVEATPELSAGVYAEIVVADDGPGMDAETLARVLEPFFTTKPMGQGTGLGLPVAHGIVSQHGGDLAIESTPGRGTTVRLLFPAAAVAAVSDPYRTGGPTPLPSPPVAGSPPVACTASILVVEDEDGVRQVAVRSLRRLGFRVEQASGGQEALALVDRLDFHPDILMTDVMMPGMDGPHLAAELRGLMPRLKVIFMSGYAEGAVFKEGRPQFPLVFLEKPFHTETLAGVVRQVMEAPD